MKKNVFLRVQNNSNCYLILGVGVMATLQILVLSLKVRVLHAQPILRNFAGFFVLWLTLNKFVRGCVF